MITQNTALKALAALVASGTIHLGVLFFLNLSDRETEIEGGAASEIAVLGNDFQDLVAAGDQLEPVEAEVIVDDTTVERAETVDANEIEPEDFVEPIEKVEALEELSSTHQPLQAPVVPPTQLEALSTEQRVQPDRSTEVIEAVKQSPDRIDEIKPLEVLAALPLETIEPVDAIQPSESLEALPNVQAKPIPSVNPRPRVTQKREPAASPKSPGKTAKKPPKRQKVVNQRQGRKQANAQTNTKKGRADGQKSGRSETQNAEANRRQQKAGNAAVSNYPGKVQRRIARTRHRKVGGQGTARIRFVISSSGRIASISVARSSGSAQVDRAALDHIRRAAPFPKPPPGARTRFVIPIRVRG